MKIVLCGLLAAIVASAAPVPAVCSTYRRPRAHAHLRTITSTGDRYADLVLVSNHRANTAYARQVSRAMRSASRKTGVPVEVIAATAYTESHFSMQEGPQQGIMQLTSETVKELHKNHHRGRADTIEGNFLLGAWQLRSRLSSRGGTSRMWKVYSGAGPGSRYVRRCRNTLRRIARGDLKTWQNYLKRHGDLWH